MSSSSCSVFLFACSRTLASMENHNGMPTSFEYRNGKTHTTLSQELNRIGVCCERMESESTEAEILSLLLKDINEHSPIVQYDNVNADGNLFENVTLCRLIYKMALETAILSRNKVEKEKEFAVSFGQRNRDMIERLIGRMDKRYRLWLALSSSSSTMRRMPENMDDAEVEKIITKINAALLCRNKRRGRRTGGRRTRRILIN